MVRLEIAVTIKEGKHPEFFDIARPLMESIVTEGSCIACRLSQNPLDKAEVLLLQEWNNMSSLRKHIRGKRFYVVLVAIELLSEKVQITLTEYQNKQIFTKLSDLFDI